MDNKNVECEYENNIIKYIENEYTNTVDLNNNIFKRECNEYLIVIDFNKLEEFITLKDKKLNFSLNIKGSIEKSNNKIHITYYNDDKREIIIYLL